jgi:hypothetical protein
MGQNMFKAGMEQQGVAAHADTMQPSLRCVPISNSKFPKALTADWVAPNAVLVGDVTVGDAASIWHGVTLRGDRSNKITVGKNSMI